MQAEQGEPRPDLDAPLAAWDRPDRQECLHRERRDRKRAGRLGHRHDRAGAEAAHGEGDQHQRSDDYPPLARGALVAGGGQPASANSGMRSAANLR